MHIHVHVHMKFVFQANTVYWANTIQCLYCNYNLQVGEAQLKVALLTIAPCSLEINYAQAVVTNSLYSL